MSKPPDLRLAFVTGATSGFGRAIARRLIGDGLRVIAAGRRKDRLAALQDECGDALLPLALDITDTAALAALPGSLPQGWRDIDLLVNNAGLALGLGSAAQADLDQWDQMIATNITGLVHLTRALLPSLMQRQDALIVNLGSIAGTYPYPGGNVYGATKAFVAQFSLNLRADLLGSPVRVSNIEPGLAGGTEFSQVRFSGDIQQAADVYKNTDPLIADDIAEAVSWLVGLPARVNVNRIEIMPRKQAFGPLAVHKG